MIEELGLFHEVEPKGVASHTARGLWPAPRRSDKVLRSFARRLGVTYEELSTGRPPDAEAALEQEIVAARQALSAGEHEEAQVAFGRVAKRAAQYGLQKLHYRAALGEAFCSEIGGKLDVAVAKYEALQESIPDDYLSCKADAVAGRARCLRMLGDVPYSTYLLEGYLSHLTRVELMDPDALHRIHITLVASYFEAGLVKQAGGAADEALRLGPKVSDTEMLADMHINVARVRVQRREFAAAARSFAKAEDLFRELGLQTEVGRAHLARAFLMKDQERFDDARTDLTTALEIFEKTENLVNQTRTLSELGALERMVGNVDHALFLLERAVRMAGKGQPASAAISHRELALCHAELGQPAKMRTHFKKAIDLLEGSGDHYELSVTYRALGDALREEKDYQKACDAYRSAAVALEAA